MELFKNPQNLAAGVALLFAIGSALVAFLVTVSTNAAKDAAALQNQAAQKALEQKISENSELTKKLELATTGGDGFPELGIYNATDRFIINFRNNTEYPIFVTKIDLFEPSKQSSVDDRTRKDIGDLPRSGFTSIPCSTLAPKQFKDQIIDFKASPELKEHQMEFRIQTINRLVKYFIHFKKIEGRADPYNWDYAYCTQDDRGRRLGQIFGTVSILTDAEKGTL